MLFIKGSTTLRIKLLDDGCKEVAMEEGDLGCLGHLISGYCFGYWS